MTTRFRSITERSGMLLSTDDGIAEFSPFWDYDAQVSLPWLLSAYSALQDQRAVASELSIHRHQIPVNVTVPAVEPERAQQIVRASSGCTTAKVKVGEPGQDLAADLSRVAAVREVLGADGKIRIDVNGGWSLDEAVTAVTQLDRAAAGLEYAEQPVAAVTDLARLRRSVHIPIVADESIRRAEDPYLVKQYEAADAVVLKVQPLGGVRACLQLAQEIELPVVVSSALESSVGLYQGMLLAAALPQLPYACGLATMQLLRDDTTVAPYLVRDGNIALAPPVLRTDLATVAADPELTQRWHNRLQQVAALRPELREFFADIEPGVEGSA